MHILLFLCSACPGSFFRVFASLVGALLYVCMVHNVFPLLHTKGATFMQVEEKMRVLHERKNQRLKRLDEKGAEAHRVDVTRTLVRSLSTKIRISIQIVDKISEKINKLRDEELWPQLNGFIQGLTRMWKSMLECHQNQCQAIVEAKRLDSIALHKHFSEAHLEATLHLEHELLNWILRFSCWVSTQKGYIIALNNWLMKCLLYVPEETPDGIVPFSPGRIGAPPVFVICNHWSQSLERVSEKEVVDSMLDFATNVLQLWEQDKLEMRHRVMANKDMERKVKNLEREDQKIQKEMQALEKRMILVSGEENVLSLNRHAIYQSDTSKNSSLQAGLQRIFEAMERFSANCLKVYEELLQRIEEDNLAREHEKVS
nr:nitrate regulatory gene2 protein [Ipomoea batatas]